MAYIYKITNNINGKIYIGKTEFSVEKRFKEHCQDSKKERCEKRLVKFLLLKHILVKFAKEKEKLFQDIFGNLCKFFIMVIAPKPSTYIKNYNLIFTKFYGIIYIQKLKMNLDNFIWILI